jgi:membrane protein DedA with SNARE-associated domain
MGEIASLLEKHGYALLALIVFFEASGIPVPAALALVAAGAASAAHHLRAEIVLLIALPAMMLGDSVLFVLGRYSGWALLGLLCRIALNPEACILRSAESFYKRGRTTLMFAKFIPGINTLAPPLAGSMRMGVGQFLRLDFVAAFLYVLVYFGAGYLFSEIILAVVKQALTIGHWLEWLLLFALAGYLAYRAYIYWRHREYRVVPRIQVAELAQKLTSGEGACFIVADVRSHGYYDPGAMRIRGSIRLEPNNLREAVKDWPRDREIYLYCT